MKKNWFMRVGGTMLALTLITSSFVGGTFAKYTTANNGTDTARVAKWGVEVTASGTAFATSYVRQDTSMGAKLTGNGVVSSTVDNVIAPGTFGTLAATSITGTPEVAVKITNKIDSGDFTLTNWGDYCPLIFAIDDTEGTEHLYYIDGTSITNVAGLQDAVIAAVNAVVSYAEPNTDLSGTTALNLSWEWPFDANQTNLRIGDNAEVPSTLKAKLDDVKDTALGDAAAGGSSVPEISITVSTTVTQVD